MRSDCDADEVQDKNADANSDGNGEDSSGIVHKFLIDANALLPDSTADQAWVAAHS